MGYMESYKAWCANEYFDEATRAELKSIEGNEKEIEDRFYKDLEFGTGGLRGVIGNGTNRMNIYTVRKATQGLANFIKKENAADRGVAIAYDSRRMSPEFADEAALCLNANGIKAYIFPSLRPTPELSFAVRQLHCIAGIVITASHNPPEYNGYKVYWEDGAQITAPKDTQIITEVKAVTDYNTVKTMEKDEAEACGLYNVIGYDMDEAYIKALKKMSINGDIIRQVADDIKIVYTPFHGTGNVPVRRILKELGFKHVYIVKEQEKPDPDFTTLEYPNPEDPKAFTLALKLALKRDSFFVLSTFCSASSTFCRCSRKVGLFSLARINASSTGIIFPVGRPGISNSITVFLSRFRKEANENIARFKAICAFCNVLCAFTLSSCNVSKSARDMAAIL